MKKILLWAGVALLVLIVGVVLVVGLSLGKIVKAGVETVGPKLTKTTITLDAVDVSLMTGSAKVKNLVVGNPEGYKAPHAISVGMIAVSASPMSVLSDKIIVKSIRVESPEITFEGNPFGENNLTKIEANVNAVAASLQMPSTNQLPNTVTPVKPGKTLEVDEFIITGARVHLASGPTLPLPDIVLHDLGKNPEGITVADLTKKVLSEEVSGVIKTVGSAAVNIGKGAVNIGKDAGKAVGAGVNKAASGLGGLLKKTTK